MQSGQIGHELVKNAVFWRVFVGARELGAVKPLRRLETPY
jgi:hypothetical protein